MYAGIDYSMTCPAIFVGDKKDFNKGKSFFYYLPKSKRDTFDGLHGSNINGRDQKNKNTFTTDISRFLSIAEWAIEILNIYKVKHVCLEGYAMGAKGKIFNIAENTALLKLKMFESGITYITPSPNEIKKWFTGKGNAKKIDMHDRFETLTTVSISDIMKKDSDSSPVSDIVDSYAMFLYAMEHFNND